MEWISVKDKLPEMDPKWISYLCTDGYTCFVVAYRQYYNDWGFEEDFGAVTHWMPLPQPPKE